MNSIILFFQENKYYVFVISAIVIAICLLLLVINLSSLLFKKSIYLKILAKTKKILLFGCIYICFIMIFTILYYFNYEGLYFSSIRHEQYTRFLEENINEALTNKLSSFYSDGNRELNKDINNFMHLETDSEYNTTLELYPNMKDELKETYFLYVKDARFNVNHDSLTIDFLIHYLSYEKEKSSNKDIEGELTGKRIIQKATLVYPFSFLYTVSFLYNNETAEVRDFTEEYGDILLTFFELKGYSIYSPYDYNQNFGGLSFNLSYVIPGFESIQGNEWIAEYEPIDAEMYMPKVLTPIDFIIHNDNAKPYFYRDGFEDSDFVSKNVSEYNEFYLSKFMSDYTLLIKEGIGRNDKVSRFFRSLYLSMITITTIGYGDVIPITRYTRMLVGLEAVLGIIILGIFAASLLSNNSNKETISPKKRIIRSYRVSGNYIKRKHIKK